MPETPLAQALREAPTEGRVEPPPLQHEYFVFRVGGLALGVGSSEVREVTRLSSLTPLPRAPAFVLGVVSHRGEVFPLVDLLGLLGQGERRAVPRTRLFVASVGRSVVGFVVDDVEGLRSIDDAERLPPPIGPGPGLEHVEGVCQVEEVGSVTLVSLPRIVATVRRKLVSR